ncbi:hypothetical protein ACWDG1_49565, partial [Streptomyces sp. NPDC001177]
GGLFPGAPAGFEPATPGETGPSSRGFAAATLYAYTLLQPNTAARVRDAFPVLGSPAGSPPK